MVKETTLKCVEDLIARYPHMAECRADLQAAVEAICESYRNGHKLIACGNGGSASDSEHIVGELMKGFLLKREIKGELAEKIRANCGEDAQYLIDNLQGALPALSMVNQVALNTAFANDQAPDLSFAQQLLGMGDEGDVLLAISTSGNSTNVIYALEIAKVKGVKSIGLLGHSGGKIKARSLADINICVPEDETFKIQELHLPVYHMLCIAVENEFFGAWD
ncbi:MAG: SIS domain-containing protein [Selenomonas sp.]|nr:SIS domain-containing protein [Selenomonas sp.]